MGLMNDTDTVLSLKFDQISLFQSHVLTNQNDYVGLMNCKLNYILPPIYENIEPLKQGDSLYWVAHKNGGSQLFDERGNLIVSNPKGTFLTDFNLYMRRREYKQVYALLPNAPLFEFTAEGKHGIMSAKGEVIIQPRYDKILLTAASETADSSTGVTFYWILKEGKEHRLTEFDLDLIYKDTVSSYFHYNGINDYYATGHPDLLMMSDRENEEWFRYYNVKTNAMSDTSYYNTWPMGDLFPAFKDEYESRKVYLNMDLEEVFECDDCHLRKVKNGTNFYYLSNAEGETCLINQHGDFILPGNNYAMASVGQGSSIHFWTTNLNEDPKNGKYHIEIYSAAGDLWAEVDCDHYYGNTFFNETYKKSNCDTLIHDEVIFVAIDGKLGGYNATGGNVIPSVYDNFFGGVVENKNECAATDGYLLAKNGKQGVISPTGEILIPFEYDEIGYQFDGMHVDYYKKSGKITVRNRSDSTVIIEGADAVFHQNTFSYSGDDTYRRFYGDQELGNYPVVHNSRMFVIKNKSLYNRQPRAWVLCDSNHFIFQEEPVIINNHLVFKDGSVWQNREGWVLEKTPHFFINSNVGDAEIIDKSGNVLLELKNFYRAKIVGDYIKLKTTKNQVGILTKDGSDWLYPPKYTDLYIPTDFPAYAWELRSKNNPTSDVLRDNQYWVLINQRGQPVHRNRKLDFPATKKEGYTGAKFREDNKFGILDSTYNIALEANYDFILETGVAEIYFVKQNGKWQLFHAIKGFYPYEFDDISLMDWSDDFQVYQFTEQDTLIGYIGFKTDFYEILPLTPSDSVFNSQDLSTLLTLNKPGVAVYPLRQHIVSDTAYASALQLLNNRVIRSHYDQKSINGLNFSYVQVLSFDENWKSFLKGRVYSENHTFKNKTYWRNEINPTAVNYRNARTDHVYYSNLFVYSKKVFEGYDTTTHRDIEYFANYLLFQGDKPIALADLFENADSVLQYIQERIAEEINLRQMFGIACVDLEGKVNEFMNNWRFNAGGIVFTHNQSGRHKTVYLDYPELYPFLKPEIQAYGNW